MSDSLDIRSSLNKARWVLPDVALDDVERLARAHDVPEIIARILCQRGVEDVAGFLNPTLKDHFPDPFSLAGMEECADYLASAIQEKRSVAIFGDFDVDGATSSALFYRFLKHCGVEAPIYIPDRLTEGYGPNVEAFQALKDAGAEIVVLLDCGTTAFETIAAGRAMGLEIVVLDHHEAGEELPEAVHVINPKRKDDGSGLDMLAAVGVTFLTCVAVNNKLHAAGFYKGRGLAEPSLKDWLDLVALGTVCDMVPLTGANRLFVKYGFYIMQNSGHAGLAALMEVAGVKGVVNTYHAGFALGPRINAGSRVHKSDLGARLLSTDDAEEARNIAWTLNDCNDKRKGLQQEMEREALEKVEAEGLDQRSVIIVDGEGWHTGLSGLVAGRLKDKYKKPACVIAYVENEQGEVEGRGSGRSVVGIHIAQAFIDALDAGVLEKGGGHAMAGGFTVSPERLGDFKAFMESHISKQAAASNTCVETHIDGVLTVQGARPDFVQMIQAQIGPFGQEHPEPLFLFQNVRLHSVDIVGEAHIRVMMSDWEGGTRMKAMAFRSVGTPLGDALLQNGRAPFHLVGHLKIDDWSGRDKVELHIRDGAFVMGDRESEVA
jgi:single-stranded-DNA-specific exonuclease